MSAPAKGEAAEVMAGATRAVFLSYRREETRHIAGRLADRLTDRLGPEQVFMDVDVIEPGADFAAAIAREVASCRILIALIGPTWATATGWRRRRRLDDPDDFVVLEIRAALERGIPVIPVLVDGAIMPDRGDLPEALQGLARRNAVRLDHDTFRTDLTSLLNAVDRILSTPAPKATEPTVGAEAGVANRALATPAPSPQRAAEPDSPGVRLTGQEDAAGAHHRSRSASPPTPLSPIPWLRARPKLLITVAIVITLAVAGGIVLLSTNNGGPSVTATVPVGDNPRAVAVSPDGRRAYITNITHGGSGSVSVIDTGDNTVTATVPVGDNPRGVAVSPDGRRAYIANGGSGSVSVIDTGDNTVTATVPVGAYPWGVAVSPNRRRAYITNIAHGGSGSVSVIDTGDNTVTATVPVGANPWGVAVSPDGRRAYIANSVSGSVSVIDTGDNTVTATVPVGANPRAVAVSPDRRRAYIANGGSGSVSVIDTGDNTVTATVSVGDNPRGVAVSPDGRRAYITNYYSGSVSVIDTGDNTVTATVPVGAYPWGVAVSSDGRRAYITNSGSGSVSVINVGPS